MTPPSAQHSDAQPSAGLRPGVLFDVDGTLLDTNYLHVLAWWQGFRDAGHEQVTMAQLHRAIGIASAELVRHVLGHDDEAPSQGHSARYEPLRELAVAFPRVRELLDACTGRGLAVVLATSGGAADLEWMVPALGGEEAIAGATTSEGVDASKPAPDLLSVAMEEHHLDPARTVVVGDTVWDVQAAARAGLPCVALTCGGIAEAELLDAGAVAVHADPAALLEHLDDLQR